MPKLRVATVHHVGSYSRISEAFQKLGALAAKNNLFAYPEAQMLAIYHDDPEGKPAAELQSEAGIVIPENLPLPEGLGETTVSAGRYAMTTHVGSYRARRRVVTLYGVATVKQRAHRQWRGRVRPLQEQSGKTPESERGHGAVPFARLNVARTIADHLLNLVNTKRV